MIELELDGRLNPVLLDMEFDSLKNQLEAAVRGGFILVVADQPNGQPYAFNITKLIGFGEVEEF